MIKQVLIVVVALNTILACLSLAYSLLTPSQVEEKEIIIDCVNGGGNLPCTPETLFGIFFSNHIRAEKITIIAHGREGFLGTTIPYYEGASYIIKYYPFFMAGIIGRFHTFDGKDVVGVNVRALIDLSKRLGLWRNNRDIVIISCDRQLKRMLENN